MELIISNTCIHHWSGLPCGTKTLHCSDVIMSAMASQITGVSVVYSTVCSGADHRKHQSSTSRAFVKGIRRWPVDSPHKGPVTRKCFDLITSSCGVTHYTAFTYNGLSRHYWQKTCIAWPVYNSPESKGWAACCCRNFIDFLCQQHGFISVFVFAATEVEQPGTWSNPTMDK